jgi:4-hydroxybenzoate polyprenyltransferase
MPAQEFTAASDIRAGWLDRLLPPGALPYARLARLDRPIGTWLLLFPCWWGMALAGSHDVWLAVLFAIGALAMRGAGCTINDIADREFDGRVARTALRPIPSGAVSVKQALIFLAGLLAIGAAVLFCLRLEAIAIGVAALPLVVAYPFMKRITYWPQAFLGLTFNWGVLVGWAAIGGWPAAPALLLYAAGIAWTLGYDTIYAHQDKEDDALIGVKSTALLFRERSRGWIAGFYAATVLLAGAAGAAAGMAWPFWLGLATAGVHLAAQTMRVRFDDPADCLYWFKSNRWVGWLLLTGFIAGQL